MGGSIAALFAGLYPDLVDQLIMIEPIGLYPDPFKHDPSMRMRHWIESHRDLASRLPKRYETLEEAYQRMQSVNPHLTPTLAKHLTIHGSNQNEDGTYSWKFDNYTRTGTPYDIPHEDCIELWKRISCPVLIINSQDGYPHRIGQDDTLQHFSNAKLITIERAGHWTHHDQCDRVVTAVREFLQLHASP